VSNRPINRDQARELAITANLRAEEDAKQRTAISQPASWAAISRSWSVIGATFPAPEETVVDDQPTDTEETFQAWTARQIEKLSAIIQETIHRVDRLETAGPSRRIDDLRENQDRSMGITNLEWQTIQELRAGRLVTHTPDYIAQLRNDAPSDDQVVVSQDYIDELKALAQKTSVDPINQPSKHDLMKAVVVQLIHGLSSRAVIVSPGDLREATKVDIVCRRRGTVAPGSWQVRTHPVM
jgi:hypothetical protein